MPERPNPHRPSKPEGYALFAVLMALWALAFLGGGHLIPARYGHSAAWAMTTIMAGVGLWVLINFLAKRNR
jgi:hypothetical protein